MADKKQDIPSQVDDVCFTCAESCGESGECPGSQRPCGHHCNHIWDQDTCHWCPAHINDDGYLVGADGKVVDDGRDG